MKKITAIIMAVLMLFSFAACQSKELTPTEKFDAFITENGTQQGDSFVLESEQAVQMIHDADFTIAHMDLKAAPNVEFKVVKSESGVTLKLIDECITDNGMKMERSVILNPDGTFKFTNSLIMNGTDMGLKFEGEIPAETYTKENTPVITDSQLAPGATLNDASKETMKDYIDLTLDCYSVVLSQEGLGITLADMGYSAYIAN